MRGTQIPCETKAESQSEREGEGGERREREIDKERERETLSHTSLNSEAAFRRKGGSPEVKHELNEAGVMSMLCHVRIPICQSEGLDEVKRTRGLTPYSRL